jgi:reverse transcriptase-like protein
MKGFRLPPAKHVGIDSLIMYSIIARTPQCILDENKEPIQDIGRERIQGGKFFTKLDLILEETENIRHSSQNKDYTNGCCLLWTQEGTVGICQVMSEMLKEYLNEFVVVYFDDVIIFSKTMTEHWDHVRKVLEKLRKRKLT